MNMLAYNIEKEFSSYSNKMKWSTPWTKPWKAMELITSGSDNILEL